MQLPYHDRYAYSPIVDRPDYSWPDGKRLAVYLGLNIEHFAFGAGEGHLLTVAGAAPDPRTFAWRDYGNRVGVWRCLELFDELNLPAAHLINTAVFDYAPRIVDALKARGDEFIGHGRPVIFPAMSRLLQQYPPEAAIETLIAHLICIDDEWLIGRKFIGN
jgi:allantoinase